jgi:hypothetical protein
MSVTVTMKSGEKHSIRGYSGEVAKAVEDGVENDMTLIPLEKDTIPTGQMMYLNPAEVESVKDNRY